MGGRLFVGEHMTRVRHAPDGQSPPARQMQSFHKMVVILRDSRVARDDNDERSSAIVEGAVPNDVSERAANGNEFGLSPDFGANPEKSGFR